MLQLFATAAATSYLEQLQAVDDIRLKDRAAFQAQLTVLQEAIAPNQLTKHEEQYLLLLVAYEHAYREEFDEALEVLQLISQLDTHLDSTGITLRAKGLAFNIYILKARYLEAFRGVDELLKRSAEINDEIYLYHVLGPVLLLYNEIEHFDLVQQLVARILKHSQNNTIRCRIQTMILPGVLKKTGFDAYLAAYDSVTALCQEAEETVFNLITIRNHMFTLLEQQQTNNVLALFDTHFESARATGYPVIIFGFQAAAAAAYMRQGDLQTAKTLLHQAKEILPANRLDPTVVAVHRVLYEQALQSGELQDIVNYSADLLEAELALYKQKADRQLAYQIASSDTHLREQQIQLLDKDNELLSLERNLYQQQAQNRNLMLYLLISLTLMLAVLAYRGIRGSRRFRRMAEYDQLTGISNRYHFNQQAKLAISYCQKNQRPLSTILFDLDYFKSINDQFGHAAGDWALQQVVSTCRQFMRNSDIFGRVGGEEFAIVLPDCVLSKAEMLAEICREALASIDTSKYDNQFTITASFGVSDVNQSGYDLTELLANADKALYQAKNNGRNQVFSAAEFTPVCDMA